LVLQDLRHVPRFDNRTMRTLRRIYEEQRAAARQQWRLPRWLSVLIVSALSVLCWAVLTAFVRALLA
jgi:hypothetical protein